MRPRQRCRGPGAVPAVGAAHDPRALLAALGEGKQCIIVESSLRGVSFILIQINFCGKLLGFFFSFFFFYFFSSFLSNLI